MTTPAAADNARFVGSIPPNYDRYLGPVLFEPYARDLARRLQVKDGARVLEVACGTGVATRHFAAALPPHASLLATDLNEPMIDIARGKLRDERRVAWRQADACALPFDPATFDALVCQFGLMFVPEKDKAVREFARVLRPGGRLLLSTWESLERNRFASLAHETIGSFFTADPPTFYEVPFSLGRGDVVQALLADAGLEEIAVEPVALEGTSPTAHDLATGLLEGNPVGAAIRERATATDAAVIDALAKKLAQEFGDRPARVPLRALVFTARAPKR